MYWVELDSLLHREVQHSPQSVQSPWNRSLFFQEFLGSSCWSTVALRRDCGLLLETRVQLVVSCTTIEAQVVFETLLALINGQLAIADQLGREVHPQSIRLFLGSGGQRWLGGRVFCRWGCWKCFCLILGSHGSTGGESFSLLLGVRLKGLFLHLLYMVVFAVSFPVAVINSYC